MLSIILGVLLGGDTDQRPGLRAGWSPSRMPGDSTPASMRGRRRRSPVIMGCYALAALINWYIPDTGVGSDAC